MSYVISMDCSSVKYSHKNQYHVVGWSMIFEGTNSSEKSCDLITKYKGAPRVVLTGLKNLNSLLGIFALAKVQ